MLPTRGGKKRPLQEKLSEISKSFRGREAEKKFISSTDLRLRKKVLMQSNSCVLLILVPIALAKVSEVQE